MLKSRFTILVSSCDAYNDLWEPFFYFLNKNWPDLSKLPILLNTESKGFKYKNLDIKRPDVMPDNISLTWSKRLLLCLNNIETDYVLFLLEDFFIETLIDEDKINFCLDEMDKDKSIKHFGFVPTLWENIDDKRYIDFELRKNNSPFKVNTQAGLWRKSELIKLIRVHESPWDFETYASIRSRLRPGKYYIAKEGRPQAFNYDWFNGGAVHGGKWTKKAVELLKESDINVDFLKRGFDTDTVLRPEAIVPRPLERNVFGRIIIRISVVIKHWKSLF